MSDEKIYEELHDLRIAHAKAKAERVYLSKFTKSKIALLMIAEELADPKLSAKKQERNAYAHPEYIGLLEGLKATIEIEEATKHKIDAINMKFESWRTKEATKRAEINLR